MVNEANSKMNTLIIIAGMSGVGKTTILKELKKIADEKKINISIINFGTIMNSVLKDEGFTLTRDEIRKQKIKNQQNIQLKTAEVIANKSKKGLTIVDTHMFISTEIGFFTGLPYEVLKRLKPSLLILIEASAKDILKRRLFTSNRDRDEESIEEIELGLNWSRYIASACSTLVGVPVRILTNNEGKQNEAAQSLFILINHQFGE